MKLSRLAGIALATICATSLVAASVASAAAPEFVGGPAKFTAKTGTMVLEASAQTVTCTSGVSTGEVNGTHTVGSVIATFTGCSGKRETSTCTLKNRGGTAGTIVTSTLDGELGKVAKAEAASEVGLLLLPSTGKAFVTLEGTCLEPELSAVEGAIAGEASPIGKKQLTGSLIFKGGAGSQSIKTIEILGVSKKASLKALAAEAASENIGEAVTYAKEIEVT